MARFNTAIKGSTKTVNHEGGSAYKPSAKLELMLRTMGYMMGGDAAYEKADDTIRRIRDLVRIVTIDEGDEKFVPNLAAFGRNVMYLRSAPTFLIVEYAKLWLKNPNAYHYVAKVLKRADEPAEALSYYLATAEINPEVEEKRKADALKAGKKYVPRRKAPIPRMLKKGIGEAMNAFTEYQFGKYKNDKKSVKLKDVVFLTHPKPKDGEQQVLFDKIVNGTLATPLTWETYISKNGSSKETWTEILPEMPFMATLRNLRNLVEHDVDLDPVIAKLTDPKVVKNSKQFPYRYFSAYKALAYEECPEFGFRAYAEKRKDVPTKLLDAVNDAMDMSMGNVPKIAGKTFVASDNSGSMLDSITPDDEKSGKKPKHRSNVQCIDVASLFSAISLYLCDEAKVGVFGATYATVPLSKRSSILDNMEKIRKKAVGHSTNAWLAVADILSKNEFYDRIFIFSDMQCYNTYGWSRDDDLAGLVNRYRKEVNPNCRLYSFDVAHYGLLKFPEGDPLTCPIVGYSDAVFRFVPMFEENHETMLKAISAYVPK